MIANGVIHRTIRFADEVYNEPPRVLIFQEAEAECPDDEHLEIQNLPILNGTLPNYHLPKGEHSICKCFWLFLTTKWGWPNPAHLSINQR